MAGNLIQYTLLFSAINGQIILQANKVSVKRDTKAIPVDTLALGLAGMSPGSPQVMYEVSNAVPAGGFEFNAGVNMLGLVPAKIFIQGPGGQTLKTTCVILSDSLTQSVNAAAEYSFSALGPMVDWS
jgi:hypothetical protein